MTAETVQPLIDHDAAQMRQHVDHLFGGWLDGCHDGQIELAWCDGKDGKLRHAVIFGTDELDELVARAVQVNCIPGQNVYIGQALRKPDIPPFGRCTDADFFAMPAFYVDIDDDVLKAARERYRQAGCPPTAVVVTGRQRHIRAQMLWRQVAVLAQAAKTARIAWAVAGQGQALSSARCSLAIYNDRQGADGSDGTMIRTWIGTLRNRHRASRSRNAGKPIRATPRGQRSSRRVNRPNT